MKKSFGRICAVTLEERHRQAPKCQKFLCLVTKEITPLEYRLLLSEALHHVRTGLDGMIVEIAKSNGVTNIRNAGIPFSRQVERVNDDFGSKLKGVNNSVKTMIRKYEPWKGGTHSLYRIALLNNLDKHDDLISPATSAKHIQMEQFEAKGLAIHFDGALQNLNEGVPIFRAEENWQINGGIFRVKGSFCLIGVGEHAPIPAVRECRRLVGLATQMVEEISTALAQAQ